MESSEIGGDAKSQTEAAPRLFIDADGFPNIDLSLEIAKNNHIDVVLVGNYTQNLSRFEGRQGVEIMEVAEGSDAADFSIISAVKKGDMLLTGDIGLASVVLAAGVKVLDSRGNEYRAETIDYRLHKRHEGKKRRRGGGRTKGPRKLTSDDIEKFENKLNRLIDMASPSTSSG
ncbi:MAG: DUF188 domain-containing protein [Proteobacteria bacterium]|nr:DUF188 domain-containing protein [Pseudomonadota bacterium]